MIEQKTPDCALGLTSNILSAWQDGDLRSDEMQRIREHTATCAACQQCLGGFATVARALGQQRELEPGDRVWHGVQDRIAAQTHGRGAPMRLPAWNWRGVGAVASVIVVVGLLAYVFSAVGAQRREPGVASTATVATTPTPTVATSSTLTSSTTVTGPQLSWQRVRYPSGVTTAPTAPTAVAPNDGDVAYICVAPARGGSNAHTYVTRDRGRDWVRGGDVPVGAQPASTGKPFGLECSVVVDATHPGTVVIASQWLQTGESGDISLISNFASFDYGAHWQKLVYAHPFGIGLEMGSYAGSIYTFGSGQSLQCLCVSHDQMRTWQPLPLPAYAADGAFWVNAATGALLVATNGANGVGNGDSLLLTSTDGGAHWTQLPAPSSANMNWVVQAPHGNEPWHICGDAAPPPGRGQLQANTLTCSSDGGQTWATRPALTLVQNSPKGFQYVAPADVFALASDGAVLATVIGGGPSNHVFRLPAGSSVWQDLGPQPDSDSPNPAYYPTPTGSVLWYSGASMVTATYPSA